MRNIKHRKISLGSAQLSGLWELEKTIEVGEQLCSQNRCDCILCKRPQKQVPKKQMIQQLTYNSDAWLHQILNGLTPKSSKTLKINIPDICFPSQEGFIVYQTNKKDLRIKKKSGTIPNSQLFNTLVQMKRQYKRILEQNFRSNMYDKINPQFIHKKYFNHLLPPHFHDGYKSENLASNKHKFKRYVLHDNDKYIISAIQEHKMNQKQPFCAIRYNDANTRLFNQKQFEIQCLNRNISDIAYIQAFVKTKQQVQSIFFSYYVQGSEDIDKKLFYKAELQVLIMLDGLSVYDDQYTDLDNLEEYSNELMKIAPQQYIKLMTYKIVHYLAMASRVYITQLELKWIVNDIQLYYLQDVLAFKVTHKPNRHIRYLMPQPNQDERFYRDSRYFLAVYREAQNVRDIGLRKLRDDHPLKSLETTIRYSKKLDKTAKISKTISVEPQNDKRHKKITLPKLEQMRYNKSINKKILTRQSIKLNQSTRVTLQSQQLQ